MSATLAGSFPWLTVLIAVPLLAAVALWLIKPLHRLARPYGLVVSLVVLLGAIIAATGFDTSQAGAVQLAETHAWIPQIGVSWALGINGLGLAMVLLATALVPLVLLSAWNDHRAHRGVTFAETAHSSIADTTGGTDAAVSEPGGSVRAERTRADRDVTYHAGFVALVLALEACMVAIFAARDVFLFYVVFEAMLIPVYFLIGVYGGPNRKAAALKFLLYSLAGGLVMLVGVIGVYVVGPGGEQAFHMDALPGAMASSPAVQNLLFLAFFIGFAVKAPMVPVHTWLPDTAQEAPAGVSTLLVGVLDKVGTFGMIMICLPLFPDAAQWAAPVIAVLAIVSILYGALVAIAQRDIMRLIAYTSVSHFGFMILGIFVFEQTALTGAMVYMVAHGVSTAALFLASGALARRGGSQDIAAYGGMQRITPLLAGGWLVAGLASIALPGLSGFPAEYLVLLGTFRVNIVYALFAVLGVVLAALYILLPYQRIFTGPPGRVTAAPDLAGNEKVVMGVLTAAMLVLGFLPGPVVDLVAPVAEPLATVQDSSITALGAETSTAGDLLAAPVEVSGK